MIRDVILKDLFSHKDDRYAEFQSSLIPSADKSFFIGVRTPDLRKMAAVYVSSDDIEEFLDGLPHEYFDEYQLHAFIISLIRDFDACISETQKFLPYVDNWATCDQLSPKVFKKNTDRLLPYIEDWMKSDRTYTVRFGIGMLMRYFLDEGFKAGQAGKVADMRSEEYYINMMRAWYFATALAKQYDAVIPVMTDNRMDVWTHNMTIRKCTESYRIAPDHKEYLRTLKRKA